MTPNPSEAAEADLVEVAKQTARACGQPFDGTTNGPRARYSIDEVAVAVLSAIVPLIREQEREACAKIAKHQEEECAAERDKQTEHAAELAWNMCCNTASIIEDEIRQRSQKDG